MKKKPCKAPQIMLESTQFLWFLHMTTKKLCRLVQPCYTLYSPGSSHNAKRKTTCILGALQGAPKAIRASSKGLGALQGAQKTNQTLYQSMQHCETLRNNSIRLALASPPQPPMLYCNCVTVWRRESNRNSEREHRTYNACACFYCNRLETV